MREFLEPDQIKALMRQVAAGRKRVTKQCGTCKVEMVDVYKKRQYCSARCRKTAERELRRAATSPEGTADAP